MARISKYTQDTSVSGTDKLLGSDSGGSTKNFSIESLSNFFAGNAGVYKHHQNNSATSWGVTDGSGGFWIVHDLNLEDYLPNVTLKMSTGVVYTNVQGMGLVTYVDKNKLRIQFAAAESGYAYIKK
jgi:hypothetical protein